MPSIVDMIAKAESDAEEIRKKAQQDAAMTINAANARAMGITDEAEKSASEYIAMHKKTTKATCDRLHEDIISKERKDTDARIALARTREDKAVRYIIDALKG